MPNRAVVALLSSLVLAAGAVAEASPDPRSHFSLPFENRRVPLPDGQHYLVIWWRETAAGKAAGERMRLTFRVVESRSAEGVPAASRDGHDATPEPGTAIARRAGDEVVAEGSLDHGPHLLRVDPAGFTFFEERGRVGRGVLAERYLLDGTRTYRIRRDAMEFTAREWDDFDETSEGVRWFDVVWAEPGGDLVTLAHCEVAQRIDARTGRVTRQPASEAYRSVMLHGDEKDRRQALARIALAGAPGFEGVAREIWDAERGLPVDRLAAAAILTRAGEPTGRGLLMDCAFEPANESQRSATPLARRLLPVWMGDDALAWYQHLLLPTLFDRPDAANPRLAQPPFPSLDTARPGRFCSDSDPHFAGLVALGPAAREFLEYLLGHADPAGYSSRAADALRRLGDPAAGPALRRALADPRLTAFHDQICDALVEVDPDTAETGAVVWSRLETVATFGAPEPIMGLWQPRWLRLVDWAAAHPGPHGARVIRTLRERVPSRSDSYRPILEALARAQAAQSR